MPVYNPLKNLFDESEIQNGIQTEMKSFVETAAAGTGRITARIYGPKPEYAILYRTNECFLPFKNDTGSKSAALLFHLGDAAELWQSQIMEEKLLNNLEHIHKNPDCLTEKLKENLEWIDDFQYKVLRNEQRHADCGQRNFQNPEKTDPEELNDKLLELAKICNDARMLPWEDAFALLQTINRELAGGQEVENARSFDVLAWSVCKLAKNTARAAGSRQKEEMRTWILSCLKERRPYLFSDCWKLVLFSELGDEEGSDIPEALAWSLLEQKDARPAVLSERLKKACAKWAVKHIFEKQALTTKELIESCRDVKNPEFIIEAAVFLLERAVAQNEFPDDLLLFCENLPVECSGFFDHRKRETYLIKTFAAVMQNEFCKARLYLQELFKMFPGDPDGWRLLKRSFTATEWEQVRENGIRSLKEGRHFIELFEILMSEGDTDRLLDELKLLQDPDYFLLYYPDLSLQDKKRFLQSFLQEVRETFQFYRYDPKKCEQTALAVKCMYQYPSARKEILTFVHDLRQDCPGIYVHHTLNIVPY